MNSSPLNRSHSSMVESALAVPGGERTLSKDWATSPIRAKRQSQIRLLSAQDWVHQASQAALDAMFGVEDKTDVAGALEAGKAAFRANMPQLLCASMIRGYIACIGEGVRSEWLSPAEAQQSIRLAHAAMIAHNMSRKVSS